jgi:hypothetical protein
VSPHAIRLIGKRLVDPDIDAQALLQLVRSPERTLPALFVLTCIDKLIAMTAQKIPAREMQLGYAPSTISTASGSRADEIGAIAAEPTTQIDDGDGINNVFPSPIPDPDGIGKTHPLSLSA